MTTVGNSEARQPRRSAAASSGLMYSRILSLRFVEMQSAVDQVETAAGRLDAAADSIGTGIPRYAPELGMIDIEGSRRVTDVLQMLLGH